MSLGFVQKQVPDRRRISNKTTLTLTLSRPTGEGTGSPVSHSFQSGWIHRPAEDDSPSPIRWERAGVRVSVPQNPKLFLHESLVTGVGLGPTGEGAGRNTRGRVCSPKGT